MRNRGSSIAALPPAPLEGPILWLLIAASSLLVICVAGRLIVSWRNYGDLGTASGVWTATAVDLLDDGTLYRPIVSKLGYGGSRYGPLHPMLQAGLMRLGTSPITSGYLLALIGTAGSIAALYQLMRQQHVPVALAVTMACGALAAKCFRVGIAEIHGDPLALALDLWGLSVVAALAGKSPKAGSGTVLLAAACFVLSLATKFSSIFGIVAGLGWLILRGQRRHAIRLGFAFAVGVAALVLAVQWASDGRAIGVFRATAAGGGGLATLLRGPARFYDILAHSDRVSLGFWIVAVALFPADRMWRSLPGLLFIVTTVGTIVIFGTPGTGINHLMSLQAASVIVLGTRLAQVRSARLIPAAATCLLMAAGIFGCWIGIKEIRHDAARQSLAAVMDDIGRSSVAGPIYANNPFIPILANQRPYLLDGFMAHLMRQKDPQTAAKLWDDLDHAKFSACVVRPHPMRWGPEWVADDLMVHSHLDKYYLKSVHNEDDVYLPKPR